MKNAMMMIALLTATSAAMASSRDPGSLGSHVAKHSDSTQTSISQSVQESDNALVNQQPVHRHSDH
jgi:hypothetical protein